jgi:hypothetical protein
MYCNLNISERFFPFLINLVLEDKLNVGCIGFHGVDKEQGYFFWCEGFFADDVIYDGS